MSMHGYLDYITALLLTLLLVGCAARGPVREDSFQALPQKYRLLATEWESEGEIRKALLGWQVVHSLAPNDVEASSRIESLQEEIRRESDNHFRAGLDHFQTGAIASARKEFLITLAYNPDHEQALHYLKHKLIKPEYTLWEAKKNDTLRSIAKEVYHDPEKDFLIAYFNDLDIRKTVRPGTKLKLPIHEALPKARPAEEEEKLRKARLPYKPKEHKKKRPKARPTQDEEKLRKARALYNAKEYQGTLSIVEEIVAYAPSSREAVDLRNASYYELGILYQRQKDSLKSLEMFKNTDITYRDVGQRIARLKKQMKEQAEIHYNNGMTYFLAEDLEKSAEEWEKTLEYDPEHAKAERDLAKTRRLLKKLGRIQP